MATKRDIFAEATVKFQKYTFDFLEVYTHAKDWIEWRGYDLYEKKYKEIVTPGDAKEYHIVWEVEKEIDSYSKFLIVVEWKLLGVSDQEVVFHGKKTKAQEGEIELIISAYLVLDYNSKWEEHPLLKLFKGFYEKFLYTGTIRRNEDELWKEGWGLHDELKAFIELYKYK